MNDDKRKRLIQLLGMTGSKHDGEALNAARAANRLLGAEGVSWEEAMTGAGNGAARFTDADMQAAVNAAYSVGMTDGEAKAKVNAPKRTHAAWQAFAREVRDQHFGELNDWEEGFVQNFIDRGWLTPTPKQQAVFERIAGKIDMECPE